MYQRIPTTENFKTGDTKDLIFQITKRPETDYVELKLNHASMLFLGGMARAIANVFVSDVLPNGMLQTKACSSCSFKNMLKAKYCIECGEPFS